MQTQAARVVVAVVVVVVVVVVAAAGTAAALAVCGVLLKLLHQWVHAQACGLTRMVAFRRQRAVAWANQCSWAAVDLVCWSHCVAASTADGFSWEYQAAWIRVVLAIQRGLGKAMALYVSIW